MKIKGLIFRGKYFWFRQMVDGKRQCVSLGTADLTKAIELAAEHKRNTYHRNPNVLSMMREKWIASRLRDGHFRDKTAGWARNALKQFEAAVGDVPVHAITENAVAAWQRDLRGRMTPAASASYMRAIKAFFGWLEKERLISFSPAKAVKMPRLGKSNARRDYCTKEQRDLLIDNAPNADLKFVLLAGMMAGLRKGEIIEARKDWFDLANGLLYVRKATGDRLRQGEKPFLIKDSDERVVPLTSTFKAFMETHLEGLEPLDFVLQPEIGYGLAEYRYDFRRPFQDYVKSQGLEWVKAHTMRRTFGSLLVQASVSVFKVARWLGDGVAVVEAHYGHLAPGDSDIERAV